MPTVKRRRHPRVPEFPPLEELAPGVPFNPYQLFEGWQIRKAISGYSKIRPAAKYVYLFLADQVYTSDYDSHSQRTLADFVGLSVDQFQYHLARLVKHGLVKVQHDIGRQNYLWLLYHPVFAGCSPLTHRKTPAGDAGVVRQGMPDLSGTQRNDQRKYQRSDGVTLDKATSYRGASGPPGRREGEDPPIGEPLARGADNGESVSSVSPPSELREYARASDAAAGESLVLAHDARSFWYSLSPVEKRNRYELAQKCAERVIHFRQYRNDPHPDIQRQARHEVERYLAELRSFGFTLHTNGKGKL